MKNKGLSSKDKKGITLIVIAMLVLASIFLLIGWIKNKSGYDKQTFCPNKIKYDKSVVIIDKSDKWKPEDAKKIVSLISSISSNLKQFERLQIKVIHSSKENNIALIDTFFDYCNPGSEANPLYQNPRKILRAYKENFEQPLQNVTEILTKPGYAESTPLFRAVQESINYSKSDKIKLTIVSDLFEYSEDYNFYKNTPNINGLVKEFNLSGKGIDSIDVKYIRRKKHSTKLVERVKETFKKVAININASYSQETFMVTNDVYAPIQKKTKGRSSTINISEKRNKGSGQKDDLRKVSKKGNSNTRNSIEIDIEKAAKILLQNQ